MSRLIALLLILSGTAIAPSLGADWDVTLLDGTPVRIDSQTQRAMVERDGQWVPLWDAHHRLIDGDTLIIRSGIAVVSEALVDQPRRSCQALTLVEGERSPCHQLRELLCGLTDGCGGSAACRWAERLLAGEMQARRITAVRSAQSCQCLDALDDPALQICPEIALEIDEGKAVTPCWRLVERVCGENLDCAAEPACAPAQQLLAEEEGRGLNARDASRQCRRALRDQQFFRRCGEITRDLTE